MNEVSGRPGQGDLSGRVDKAEVAGPEGMSARQVLVTVVNQVAGMFNLDNVRTEDLPTRIREIRGRYDVCFVAGNRLAETCRLVIDGRASTADLVQAVQEYNVTMVGLDTRTASLLWVVRHARDFMRAHYWVDRIAAIEGMRKAFRTLDGRPVDGIAEERERPFAPTVHPDRKEGE